MLEEDGFISRLQNFEGTRILFILRWKGDPPCRNTPRPRSGSVMKRSKEGAREEGCQWAHRPPPTTSRGPTQKSGLCCHLMEERGLWSRPGAPPTWLPSPQTFHSPGVLSFVFYSLQSSLASLFSGHLPPSHHLPSFLCCPGSDSGTPWFLAPLEFRFWKVFARCLGPAPTRHEHPPAPEANGHPQRCSEPGHGRRGHLPALQGHPGRHKV